VELSVGSARKILFVLSLFSYSLAGFSKTIIISDIDDTIKKANSMGPFKGAYHFFLKMPYLEMRDLFLEINTHEQSQGEEVSFHYVSAAFDFTFNAPKWLSEHNYPKGQIAMRTFQTTGGMYDYKYLEIKKILTKELQVNPDLKVYFFGDNSDHDADVYANIVKELRLVDAHVFVRDVSTEATFFDISLPVKKIEGVNYFFSEREFLGHSSLLYISNRLINNIGWAYKNKRLIPEYTLVTLNTRLIDICISKLVIQNFEGKRRCRESAKDTASRYWNDYYSRFE
jgi:phosphatidate phosphatase APP1